MFLDVYLLYVVFCVLAFALFLWNFWFATHNISYLGFFLNIVVEFVGICWVLLMVILFLYLQFGIIYVTYFFGFFMVFKVSIRIWFDFCCDLRVMSETWPLFVSLWKLEFLLVFQYLQEFLFIEHLCIFRAFFEKILPNFYPTDIVHLFLEFQLL